MRTKWIEVRKLKKQKYSFKLISSFSPVFTIKNLEKTPLLNIESPPLYIKDMPRTGALNWQQAAPTTRECCEEALRKIQIRIRNRRLYMHPFFRSYDKYVLIIIRIVVILWLIYNITFGVTQGVLSYCIVIISSNLHDLNASFYRNASFYQNKQL